MIPPLTLLPVTAWFVGSVGPVGTAAIGGALIGVFGAAIRRLWGNR